MYLGSVVEHRELLPLLVALTGAALQPLCLDELKRGLCFVFFKSSFGLWVSKIFLPIYDICVLLHITILISLSLPRNFHWYCVLHVADNVNRLTD